MNSVFALDCIRIVLVRTSHPGNIGAAARAMKTMGLKQLYLVEPESFPDPVALSRAAGASDVLESVVVTASLAEALHGTVFSAALTARRREWSMPLKTVREAAPGLLSLTQRGDIALVFGTERSGLTNDEVELCAMPVRIPTSADFSSLNLGAAVQLLCYELRQAADIPAVQLPEPTDLASFEEVEGFYQHLDQAMIACGFYNPANPGRLHSRLRRLFGRIQLEREEVNILRGFIATMEQPRKRH